MKRTLFTIAIIANFIGTAGAQVEALPKRPSAPEINAAVQIVPESYRQELASALKEAASNGAQLINALEEATSDDEKEALAFLIAHMPQRDLRSLDAAYLLENVRYALKAREEAPWGKDIPKDIFLNDVLPYAAFNERRENWRKDFYERFMPIALKAGTMREAVLLLNTEAYKMLQVEYHGTKRLFPNQSPYESMRIHYASCTGLTIILIDALRAVGVPARGAGIPLWTNKSGNHTWVEVWDQEWNFIGAAEPDHYNKTWFAKAASQTDPTKPEHCIYAASYKSTGLSFPMVWSPKINWIPAVNVTERYLKVGDGASK